MITLDEAIERVRPFVEAQPEHVAPCAYFSKDGKPGCIVGNIFPDELRAAVVTWAHASNTIAIRKLLDAPDVDLDLELGPGALTFLATLQHEQDLCSSWGAAFTEALKAVGR